MKKKMFLLSRFLARPRRKALIAAFLVLLVGLYLGREASFIQTFFVSSMLALVVYLLFDRDERLQQNVKEKTQTLRELILELEESERKYRVLYDSSPDMYVSVSSTDASILMCNQTLLNETGYSKEEVIGSPIFMMYHDSSLNAAKETFQEFARTGRIRNRELALKRKDGGKIDVALNADAIRDETGNILQSISSWRDISERKKMEDELRASQVFNSTLLDTSPDLIYIYDIVESKNIYSNMGITKILGYSVEEIQEMGSSILPALMFPEDYVRYQKEILPLYQHAKDGEIIEHAYRMKDKAGKWCWLHSREVIFARQNDGKPKQIFGIVVDITERREAEDALRKNEMHLRRYFDQKILGMAITSPEKFWVEANDALCEMFGYSHEELSKLTWADTTYPEDLNANIGLFERALAGEMDSYSLEKRFLRKDGGVFHAELSANLIRKDDGSLDYIITLVNDITERKEAEESLRRLNTELDKRVEKRTKELNDMVYLMSGREVRMAELKKVITALRTQLKEAGIEPAAFDPLLGPDEEW